MKQLTFLRRMVIVGGVQFGTSSKTQWVQFELRMALLKRSRSADKDLNDRMQLDAFI